ncbi:hypothetical protein Lal_00017652 [Lupinus albus]|nr:hypothetical protein Lal_00017652 [Lupinus albus]
MEEEMNTNNETHSQADGLDEFNGSKDENVNEVEGLDFEEINFRLLNEDEVKKYREGFRDKKNELVRKRAPRKETRCGCLARMKIHIDNEKGDCIVDIKCSCKRMESFGMPCSHSVFVLLILDISQLPSCLVLERWTKKAKDVQGVNFQQCELSRESDNNSRYEALSDGCRVLCNLACKTEEDFTEMLEKVYNECSRLRSKQHSSAMENVDNATGDQVKDPVRVRAKGRVSGITSRPKRGNQCGIC